MWGHSSLEVMLCNFQEAEDEFHNYFTNVLWIVYDDNISLLGEIPEPWNVLLREFCDLDEMHEMHVVEHE